MIDLFDFHDAMASIANYLKMHGWQKGNHEMNRKAIWAYNHCDNYVNAVLAYARASKTGNRS
jgi:membrane-bound lytic murein transglycosylase B